MKDGKKMMKEFFLEIARYAGAIVVGGICMWLVVYGVIFLTLRRPKVNVHHELV
jgi:nitrate reductase gamma subunit